MRQPQLPRLGQSFGLGHVRDHQRNLNALKSSGADRLGNSQKVRPPAGEQDSEAKGQIFRSAFQDFPQGLKPALKLRHLRHDESRALIQYAFNYQCAVGIKQLFTCSLTHLFTAYVYCTRRSPFTTRPTTKNFSSARSSRFFARRNLAAGMAAISPTPMLNVRIISSCVTWPSARRCSKRSGTGQEPISTCAPVFLGRMRGKFSVMPPPVMWAMPVVTPAVTSF